MHHLEKHFFILIFFVLLMEIYHKLIIEFLPKLIVNTKIIIDYHSYIIGVLSSPKGLIE